MFTSEILKKILTELLLPSRLLVAYSGGLDSHVLLHSLVQLRKDNYKLQLQAVHINHGLSSNAHEWSEHCERVCDELDVPCVVKHIDPDIYLNHANLEKVARDQRYQIFSTMLGAKECILTAHHRDDQAETVLLRLLRGAGPKGLSAMISKRSLGEGVLVRPLLEISRADLAVYAEHENLVWIEDDSNPQTRFDRNYLRHRVMPLLQTRWPGTSRVFSRTAVLCRETQELLNEMLAEDLKKIAGSVVNTLSISALRKLSVARQKAVLRLWLKQLNLLLPSSKKLQQLQKDCLDAKEDASPLIHWTGVEVRRFNGDLYAMPTLLPHDTNVVISWDMKNSLVLPNNIGTLEAKTSPSAGIFIPEDGTVTIRFRQKTGERIHPVGRVGSHPLKKLWQEWKVPPWCRDRIPLLYINNDLAMVTNFVMAQQYASSSHRRGRVVLVEFRPGCTHINDADFR